MKKILIAMFVALGLVFTGACSISDSDLSDPSFKTLRYAGGIGEGSKFKECLDAGEKLVGDDKYYRYPNTQRENVWDTTNYGQGSNSADHEDMVVNVNGVDLFVKVKVQFFLNTDCEPVKVAGKEYKGGAIQYFHEHIGKTRKAYFNKEGAYGDGWLWVMDNYLSSSVVELVTPALRKHTPEDAWLKSEVWTEVADAVEANLQERVDDAMESDLSFFKDMKVKVIGISPETEYVALYKERTAAAKRAETAEFNKVARVAEAEANAAVAASEAKVRRAEISGYGDAQTYQCVVLAEKNLNCLQPQYIVGGTLPSK